jgi:hypothetical protein
MLLMMYLEKVKRRRGEKCMTKFKNSKMLKQRDYHGWNQFSMNKVKFNRFIIGFVHLSMIKRNYLPQSWIVC